MKITLYILLIFALFGLNYCKNGYNVYHEFARIIKVNKKYLNADCKFIKHSRTSRSGAFSCNATLYFNINSNDDFSIRVKTFRFQSNEYRPNIIDVTVPLCQILQSKGLFDPTHVTKNSNITKCPIKEGYYYFNSIDPKADDWPPHLPLGKWKIDLHMIYRTIEIAVVEWMSLIEKIVSY